MLKEVTVGTVQKHCECSNVAATFDNLIEQLAHNSCECTVCCDRVRSQEAVWSCGYCYNIFHLKCIRKWAESSAAVVEGKNQTESKNHCFVAKKCAQQYKNPNRFRLLTMTPTFLDYEAMIFRLTSQHN
uniref:Zinc finger PHD-type domain-containing protein n=1 Tax=Strigamia maritima TaxID=126957 RepID=T1JJ18_STRMM